MSVHLLK